MKEIIGLDVVHTAAIALIADDLVPWIKITKGGILLTERPRAGEAHGPYELCFRML